MSSDTVCPLPVGRTLPPPGLAITAATDVYMVFCRLAIIDRWVEMAPFGFPVVPDV